MTNAQRFCNTSKSTLAFEAKRNQRRAAQCAKDARETGSAHSAQEARIFAGIARECLFALVNPNARYFPQSTWAR